MKNHDGKKTFVYAICDVKFRENSNIKKHIIAVHEKNRTHLNVNFVMLIFHNREN